MRCNTPLNKDEMNRYSRQIRLTEVGNKGQEKLKGSSVLVIGAGGLGCPVLQYLTAAGIGTLGIVDNDWVDETNLHRQVLYTVNDIGKPKPLAAKNKLKLMNPEVNIKVHFMRLDKESALRVISLYDVIVDCTDNFAARYLINDACVILNKPVVYGAIHRFSGQLMVLNYKNGPTLRCLYPEPPHPLEVPTCDESGVLGSIAGTIGSMQATEVIKIILDLDEVLSGKLFIIDSLNFTTQIVSFKKNRDIPKIEVLGDYEDVCIAEDIKADEITSSELRKMLVKNPDIQVIDLRDENARTDIGFNCISIPYYKISRKINLIIKNDPVVFYCNYGVQSMHVINYLRKVHKMENLYNLVI